MAFYMQLIKLQQS